MITLANRVLENNITMEYLSHEILFNIFCHLSQTDLNQVSRVCRTFKRVYHRFPYVSITDIIDHLYQGHLSFLDSQSQFTTNNPAIAGHILSVLQSLAFKQYLSKQYKQTIICGRYGLLLSIYQDSSLLDIPDSFAALQLLATDFIGETCTIKQEQHSWWFHYATPNIFEWFSPRKWSYGYKFLMALLNKNVSAAYEFAKQVPSLYEMEHSLHQKEHKDSLKLTIDTFHANPFTSFKLLLYPFGKKYRQLLYERSIQKYEKYKNEQRDDCFGTVVRDMIAAGEVPPHVAHNQFFSWVFSIDHPKIVQQLLTESQLDPSKWNKFPLRLAIRQENVDSVRLLLSDSRLKVPSNRILCSSIRCENVEVFKALLDYCDPSVNDNRCIQVASRVGTLEIVQILLSDPRVDPSANMNAAIQQAAVRKEQEVFEFLLADPRVDPSVNQSQALISCAEKGLLHRVKLLMLDSRVDPSARENKAFKVAAQGSHLKVLKHLVTDSRVDPTSNDNEAFQIAVKGNRFNTVEWLLTVPGVDPGCQDNRAFISAVSRHNLRMVQLLLDCPQVDPSAQNNRAFRVMFIGVYGTAADWDSDQYELCYERSKSILKQRKQHPKDSIYAFLDIGKLLLKDPRVKSKIQEMYPEREDYGLKKSVFEDCI